VPTNAQRVEDQAAAFRDRLRWLGEPGNAALVRGGLRGIEKESLRVDAAARLSALPHPQAWGAALTHPYITTDYSEALPELVTPPFAGTWQTVQFLCDLHAFVHRNLAGELLWPFSMPCALDPRADIPIAQYGPSNSGMLKTVYRRGLGHRYGATMQAISGVHFNYSPPEQFWRAFAEHEGRGAAASALRSQAFFSLVRNFRRYGWLVPYLFGASPALDKSFKPEGHELLEELDGATWHAPHATSLRMSDLGYRNSTQGALRISANSLGDYVAGLATAVTTVDSRYAAIGVRVDGEYRQLNANVLQIENEYYSAIRPKPAKSSSARPVVALREHGVDYVEVRTLDLSPADPIGVNQVELRFMEALLLYCLLAASPPIDAAEQREIDARDLAVARAGRRPRLALPRHGATVPLAELGGEILDGVAAAAALLDAGDDAYSAACAAQREALHDPDRTPSAAVLAALVREGATFAEYGLALARRHDEYFRALPLDAEVAARLAAAARDSHADAASLEAAPAPSFAEYLDAYSSAV
jgi:glutamate--cysteine ligase